MTIPTPYSRRALCRRLGRCRPRPTSASTPEINSRIRDEGMQHSTADANPPFPYRCVWSSGHRFTESEAAGEWSVKTMEGWGMTNAHLESWGFGHPGWTNDLAWGAITVAGQDSLVLEVARLDTGHERSRLRQGGEHCDARPTDPR